MDPDAALARLRELSLEIDRFAPEGKEGFWDNHQKITALAEEMAQVFDGLDKWLSTRGFLPSVWQEGRPG